MKTERLKKGDIITFTTRWYTYATVAEVKSVGSVNLHYFPLGEDMPEWRRERHETIVLENITIVVRGAHPKLGDLLQKAKVAYDQADREHNAGHQRAKYDAMSVFETEWRAANPAPKAPDPQDALRKLNLVRKQIKIG